MLNKIAPLAIVIALGLGSAATAASVTGTLASVDTVNDTVTLTDGTTFDFDNEDYADRLSSFKAGDQVAVSYHHVGTSLEANSISPVSAGYVADTVTKANTVAPANVTYTGNQTVDYPDHGVDHR